MFSNTTATNKISTFNSIMPFGKHRGKTIELILHEDPSYLKWCIENTNKFALSPKDVQLILDCAEDDHLNWLQDNYSDGNYYENYEDGD